MPFLEDLPGKGNLSSLCPIEMPLRCTLQGNKNEV
jgi:hypothetical protein